MKISILIPARNRPEFLKVAIQSALAQEESGIEIVVSNNSDSEYKDSITKVFSAFTDSRLRMVTPPSVLSHSDHWRFLISQAEGDWVTILTDRSAFRRDWLTKVAPHMNSGGIICYCGIGIMTRGTSHLVQLPRFSNRVCRVDRATEIEEARNMRFTARSANLLNSLVPISTIHNMIKRLGKVCGDRVADVAFSSEVLACGEKWVSLDTPLYVMHSSEGGIGYSLTTGSLNPTVASFIQQTMASGGLTMAPIPQIITNMNIRVHELNSAFARAGELAPIADAAYCNSLYNEILQQATTFPENAYQLLKRYANSAGVSLSQREHVLNGSFKKRLRQGLEPIAFFAYRALGRTILNLPVASFDNVKDALEFAINATFLPNQTTPSNYSWT